MAFPALPLNREKGGGRLSVCSGLVGFTTQFPIVLINAFRNIRSIDRYQSVGMVFFSIN